MNRAVEIEALEALPVARQATEIVERKGLGHPDTICDSVAEAVSRDLCRVYLETAGRVLHHNLDKALLAAGSSAPAFGGGRVEAPMRLILGDRATDCVDGQLVPVAAIAEDGVRRWFREHLRYVDPERHVVFESALRPGSTQLTGLFRDSRPRANDTSAGVGHAPLSPTERAVLEAERHLVCGSFQGRFPMAGEDVKVMAVRRGARLSLTVALAFVDRHVASEGAYFDAKEAMRADLVRHLEPQLNQLDELSVVLNALDEPGRGAAGTYLTVLGTSADGADSGQVGRGNRVNGLISFQRPMSLEAAAGKNPVSHVGKLYNLLADEIAREVHAGVEGLEEVHALLCSRIGRPLDEPELTSLRVVLAPGLGLEDVRGAIRELVEARLAGAGEFVERFLREGRPVC